MKVQYSILALLSVAFFMTAPLFFGGKVFFDGDALTYDYPALTFYRASVLEGQSPAMNPLYLGGFPSALSPVGSYIDPINRALVHILDPVTVLHVRFLASVLLALGFAFWFGRTVGLSQVASAVLSITYLVGQTLTGISAGLSISGSMFVLPAFLLVARKLYEGDHVVRWVSLGALFVWFAWVSGFVQIVFYALVFSLGYVLYLGYTLRERIFSAQFGHFTLAAAIGTVTAAPLFAGTVLLQGLSTRVSGFGSENIGGLSVFEFARFILPEHINVPFLLEGLLPGLYVGSFGLVFVIVALVHCLRRPDALFFAGAYGLILLLLIEPTGISSLVQRLPVFSLFHTPERFLFLGAFFAAVLAGFGFDAVAQGTVKWRKRFFFWVLSGVGFVSLCLLSASAVLALLPFGDAVFERNLLEVLLGWVGKEVAIASPSFAHYLDVFHRSMSEVRASFSLTDWRFLWVVAALPVAGVVVFLRSRNRLSTFVFTSVVLLGVVVNAGFVYTSQYHLFVSRKELNVTPSAAQAVGDGRVVSFLVGDFLFRTLASRGVLSPDESFTVARESLVPNTTMFSGITRADGYEPFATARQNRLWREIIGNETFAPDPRAFGPSLLAKTSHFIGRLPLLASNNIRYVLSGYPLSDYRLREVPTAIEPAHDVSLHLYEVTDAAPYAYIPGTVRMVTEWDDSFFDEVSPHHAVIECAVCGEVTGQAQGSAHVTERGNARVSLSVSTEGPAWIVVAQSYVPGWSAALDGAPVSVSVANYTTMALFVPERGDHIIHLSYSIPTIRDVATFLLHRMF